MLSMLMPFSVPLLLISSAGQRVHNNADDNIRALVKLLNRAQPGNICVTKSNRFIQITLLTPSRYTIVKSRYHEIIMRFVLY